MAHDFNNVLSVVTGYSDLLLRQGIGEGPTRRAIEEMRKAGERAAALTRQLLAISRPKAAAEGKLDLNGLLLELEEMLRRLVGEDVEVVIDLDDRVTGSRWPLPRRADPPEPCGQRP